MALTKADIEILKGLIADVKPSGNDCSDDVQAIIKVQATQVEQLRTITDTINKVTLTLYGNGKPGLTTTVASLVSQAGFLKWIGGGFGLMVLALIWAILTHTVEIVAK